MSDTKEEILIYNLPDSVSIKGMETIIFQMKYCICKINNNLKNGIGFFCKIKLNNNLLHALITNSHLLDENDLKDNKTIKIILNEDKEYKNITIDEMRIKFVNKIFDITILEIKPDIDNIEYFFDIDDSIIEDIHEDKALSENAYFKKSIYMFHKSKENNNIHVSYGISNRIINSNFPYCPNIIKEEESLMPILSLDSFKIIGIYKNNFNKNNIFINNEYIFIKDIINEFNKEYSQDCNDNNIYIKEKILNEMTIIYSINIYNI